MKNKTSQSFARLRYYLGGDRPSQKLNAEQKARARLWRKRNRKFRKYTIDIVRHYIIHFTIEFILHSPYIHNKLYRIAITKLVISTIIYRITIIFKTIFPKFYFYLRGKRKLKNKIKKITDLEIRFGSKENFFSDVYDLYIDKKKYKKKTIYIDISQYRYVDEKTGIQRVLENVIKGFKKNPKYKNFHLSFCYFPRVRPNPCLAEYNLENKKTLRFFLPRENDLVFFLDFDTHTINENKDLIAFLKTKKIKFAAMVYDLLPFTNPRWFPVTRYKKIYAKWFDTISKLDCVFTISKTVKKKLIKNFNLTKSDHIFPIKLGANFQKKKYLKGVFNKKKNKSENPREVKFLMVGTLEPRKGHLNILRAFRVLIDKYNADVRLDIVGYLGWDYDKTLEILKQSKYSKNIFLHSSVNDKLLENFYDQSDALIAASYDEGFGLPIVEAIYNNKKVIARNIEVFREVGKNKIFYFPEHSTPTKLAAYFDNWIKKNLHSVPKYGKIKHVTWENTSNQILTKLLKL